MKATTNDTISIESVEHPVDEAEKNHSSTQLFPWRQVMKAKDELIEDLNNFVEGKEYYKRIGKAWKRGYLLYGPIGTGKSSLIAAMSNYLNYDIYDLDLTKVRTNSNLRLDPALLKPGRMDMHIHLSYCKFSAFKQLTVNYLGIHDHELFPEIEELLEEVEVTPAEVAGEVKLKPIKASSSIFPGSH
nr:ATPase, AAA-type, core [Ipomoea batatas]